VKFGQVHSQGLLELRRGSGEGGLIPYKAGTPEDLAGEKSLGQYCIRLLSLELLPVFNMPVALDLGPVWHSEQVGMAVLVCCQTPSGVESLPSASSPEWSGLLCRALCRWTTRNH
jgi:hypothetical protein